jgi:hypothetical protein
MWSDYILYTSLSGGLAMVVKIICYSESFTFVESLYCPLVGGILGVFSPAILPVLMIKNK